MGSLLDPETHVVVNPKIFGEARLRVQDPAVFSAQSAALGGDAAIVSAAQMYVCRQFKEAAQSAVAAGTSAKALGQHLQGMTAAIVAKADAELRSMGAAVQVGSWNLSFSDEDAARLKSAPRRAPAAAQPTLNLLAAGARVVATWTDGRAYPATVRGFNGTHYEIVWDGGASSAWIPRPC